MYCCVASEPHSKRGPYYLSPSIPSPIGYWSSTLWVSIPLSKRQYVPALSYLWLQVNCLWVKGVSLFTSCTILYRAVLIYLYIGCMRKRITLQLMEFALDLLSVSDLRGAPGTPPRSKFFHFHAVFKKKVSTTTLGVGAPPQENLGSATDCSGIEELISENVFRNV